LLCMMTWAWAQYLLNEWAWQEICVCWSI